MPFTLTNFGKIAGVTLLYLIGFDLIGVVMCLFFEIFNARSSTALFYVIWFVLGVFCGMLSYSTGGSIASGKIEGDWVKQPGARKIGVFVIFTTLFVLASLSILFHVWHWRYHPASDYYVPDTAPVSLTFFITVFLSVLFAHYVFAEPKQKAQLRSPSHR